MQEVLTVVCASPAEYANSKLAPLLFRAMAIVEEEARKMVKTRHGIPQLLDAFLRHAKNVKRTLKDAGVRLATLYELRHAVQHLMHRLSKALLCVLGQITFKIDVCILAVCEPVCVKKSWVAL